MKQKRYRLADPPVCDPARHGKHRLWAALGALMVSINVLIKLFDETLAYRHSAVTHLTALPRAPAAQDGRALAFDVPPSARRGAQHGRYTTDNAREKAGESSRPFIGRVSD